MQVYFTVSMGIKVRDSSCCPLNRGSPLNTGFPHITTSLYLKILPHPLCRCTLRLHAELRRADKPWQDFDNQSINTWPMIPSFSSSGKSAGTMPDVSMLLMSSRNPGNGVSQLHIFTNKGYKKTISFLTMNLSRVTFITYRIVLIFSHFHTVLSWV